MLQHATTYRLQGAYSSFDRLLVWGHNYFTFLDKKVVVLSPAKEGVYKTSGATEKTWVKVQLVAHMILACTIVIPVFALLLKFGASRLIKLEATPPFPSPPSNPNLLESTFARPSSPAPSPASSSARESAAVPPIPEPADPESKEQPTPPPTISESAISDSPPQEEPALMEPPTVESPLAANLRDQILSSPSFKALFEMRDADLLKWYLNDRDLEAKQAFMDDYAAAQKVWDTHKGASIMSEADKTAWNKMTATYHRLQPNETAFSLKFGKGTPFALVTNRFDPITNRLDWTLGKAIEYLEAHPEKVSPFKKVYDRGQRFTTPDSFEGVSAEHALWLTPKVMAITAFAFQLYTTIQLTPSLIWAEALGIVTQNKPLSKSELNALVKAKKSEPFPFLAQACEATQTWFFFANESFKKEHQTRWLNTQQVADKLRESVVDDVQKEAKSIIVIKDPQDYARGLSLKEYHRLKSISHVFSSFQGNKYGTPERANPTKREALLNLLSQAQGILQNIFKEYDSLNQSHH